MRAFVGGLAVAAFACASPATETQRLEALPTDAGRSAASPDAGSVAGSPDAGSVADGGVSTGRDARYTLRAVRNFAAPNASTTGVTFDGTNLWLISGGHNQQVHELVEVDLTTLEVRRRHGYVGLIEQLGTGVYGITWDGSGIWISVSGNTNKLVRVDPETGTILRTFASPTDLGPSDLEFDGTHLWLSSGTGDIWRIDPATGGIDRRLQIDARFLGRDFGLARRPGELFVSGLIVDDLVVQDERSGATTAQIQPPQTGVLCFAGPQLVVLDQGIVTFYDVVALP